MIVFITKSSFPIVLTHSGREKMLKAKNERKKIVDSLLSTEEEFVNELEIVQFIEDQLRLNSDKNLKQVPPDGATREMRGE